MPLIITPSTAIQGMSCRFVTTTSSDVVRGIGVLMGSALILSAPRRRQFCLAHSFGAVRPHPMLGAADDKSRSIPGRLRRPGPVILLGNPDDHAMIKVRFAE